MADGVMVRSDDRGRVLALGFGTTVAMWLGAYVCRLPVVMAPAALLLVLMFACLVGGGWRAGRLGAGGWGTGALVGLVAGLLNLLILGSVLAGDEPNRVVPSALWWVPGSLLVCAVAAGLGAAAGARRPAGGRPPDWTSVFARVGVAATMLLVVAGGLVTSSEAGLAVVDWPNSFGYTMFLYPLSRMTGGIYYEHAHRLFGSLVGLTTLVLAVHLARVESRRWIKGLGLAAVAVVVVQGVLGGLRVTGRLTTSMAPEDMAPSLGLALLHGVLGQVFLGLMVVIAVAVSRRWKEGPEPVPLASAGADRFFQTVLLLTLVAQLVLGAAQRHLAQGLLVHITVAVVVTVLAVVCGARAWGLYPTVDAVSWSGQLLLSLLAVQIVLGIGALALTGGEAVVGEPSLVAVTVATAHQACGALLLAVAVALALWTRRFVRAS